MHNRVPNHCLFTHYCLMSWFHFVVSVPLLIVLAIFEIKWDNVNIFRIMSVDRTFYTYKPVGVSVGSEPVHLKQNLASLPTPSTKNHAELLKQLVNCEMVLIRRRKNFNQVWIWVSVSFIVMTLSRKEPSISMISTICPFC